jgi:hypothetical protein
VINNIGAALSVLPAIVGSPAGLIQSNNLLNSLPAALFVASAPAVPVDFRLKALPNPATGTGLATAPVYSDLFRLRRPQIGVIDRGAVEGP